ncbi:MAG: hypothetical protein JXR97_14070 [Planctomycetes bacterium]|nr:hypothetical protein [Planctomycetota bacterium]
MKKIMFFLRRLTAGFAYGLGISTAAAIVIFSSVWIDDKYSTESDNAVKPTDMKIENVKIENSEKGRFYLRFEVRNDSKFNISQYSTNIDLLNDKGEFIAETSTFSQATLPTGKSDGVSISMEDLQYESELQLIDLSTIKDCRIRVGSIITER